MKYSDVPKRIGSHGIAVPSGYYKVLYSEDQNFTKCLYYANDNDIISSDDKLSNHQVECSELLPPAPVTDFAFLIPVLMLLN